MLLTGDKRAEANVWRGCRAEAHSSSASKNSGGGGENRDKIGEADVHCRKR